MLNRIAHVAVQGVAYSPLSMVNTAGETAVGVASELSAASPACMAYNLAVSFAMENWIGAGGRWYDVHESRRTRYRIHGLDRESPLLYRSEQVKCIVPGNNARRWKTP